MEALFLVSFRSYGWALAGCDCNFYSVFLYRRSRRTLPRTHILVECLENERNRCSAYVDSHRKSSGVEVRLNQ